jgi:hypothetical protein
MRAVTTGLVALIAAIAAASAASASMSLGDVNLSPVQLGLKTPCAVGVGRFVCLAWEFILRHHKVSVGDQIFTSVG